MAITPAAIRTMNVFTRKRSVNPRSGASSRRCESTLKQGARQPLPVNPDVETSDGETILRLTNVARDELRHLEHTDLALAVENRSKRIVGVDLSSLYLVLKTVFLDVVPKLLGQLGTRQWFRTNDGGKLVVWLNWSHEGGIRFAF